MSHELFELMGWLGAGTLLHALFQRALRPLRSHGAASGRDPAQAAPAPLAWACEPAADDACSRAARTRRPTPLA